jgi:hypothetical protein
MTPPAFEDEGIAASLWNGIGVAGCGDNRPLARQMLRRTVEWWCCGRERFGGHGLLRPVFRAKSRIAPGAAARGRTVGLPHGVARSAVGEARAADGSPHRSMTPSPADQRTAWAATRRSYCAAQRASRTRYHACFTSS